MTQIHLETFIHAPPAAAFDLARDLDFHQRSMKDSGERIVSGKAGGLIELGEEVEWEARHLGMKWRLRSRVTAFDRPYSFTDEQVRGPFASFVHRHAFRAEGEGTMMIDDWTHVPPYGPIGRIADIVLRRYMKKLLEARNAAIAAALR